MTSSLDHLRKEYPVSRSSIYLDHAAIGPLSRRAVEAMTGAIEDQALSGSSHWPRWLESLDAAHGLAARLLQAEPEEIAFVKNTSDGISLFANSLDWPQGSEVVSVAGEFPSNFVPWKALERQGVTLRSLPVENGVFTLQAIEAAITPQTRAVAVSFVQFLSGYRVDLDRLGEICERRGVLLFVDAIQGLGAFPVDVKRSRIAGLSCAAHKWLTGPLGFGLLYIRRDLADRMDPAIAGWMSVKNWQDYAARDIEWRAGARRFECGAPSLASAYGLAAAAELLLEAGLDRIACRVMDLTGHLRQGLQRQGCALFGPQSEASQSGIVTFKPRHGTADQVAQRLAAHGVVGSSRLGMVRLSPHFYNTHDEIDRALELLA